MAPKRRQTHLEGFDLIQEPALNKGTAFSISERKAFKLESLIPYSVQTLSLQKQRAWAQYQSKADDLAKNTFLESLRTQNWILYYSLLTDHLVEIMPVLYTPTEGQAIEDFSRLFRRPDGCFLAYPNGTDNMENELRLHASSKGAEPEEVELIIVSDGEQILGLGDQGCGGVAICTAKGAVYTLSAGIDPARIIAVGLDMGTNNAKLMNDELYVGWKHERVTGADYDRFLDHFAGIVDRVFPNALLHFEDFGTANAKRLLEKYRDKQSVFNDDITGTGAVALASILSALRVTGGKLTDQKIIIHGGGSAGVGIAGQIKEAMQHQEGELSDEEANKLFYIVDKHGLIHEDLGGLVTETQKPFARTAEEVKSWTNDQNQVSLEEVVLKAKATVLIGVSTQHGAFTEKIVRTMAKNAGRPIVLPLSNPTKLCECEPKDALNWTDGKALIATGSPYDPVKIHGKEFIIAEANNALVYPALGLGTIVTKAKIMSPKMILAAIEALADLSPAKQDACKGLLPEFADARQISLTVATACAKQAIEEGLAREKNLPTDEEGLTELLRKRMWVPEYLELEKVAEP